LSAPAPLCIPRGEWPEAAGTFRARPRLASIAPLVQSGFKPTTVTRATPMLKLSDDALAHLPPGVDAPGYARAGLRAGIVHIGLGNFHRAHQAVYLDDLLRQGLARDWAILGAGVRPADAAMRQALAAQDHLSTVIALDPVEPPAARITGAMTGFLPVQPDNA